MAWRDRVPVRAIALIAIVAIAAISAYRRWILLTASPFPVGVDGYFYPIQLRALLETGHLQYPASPFAFWFMAPFAAATDPIIGAKLGAAIGGALVAVPAYLLGARFGSGRGPGFIAAALASTALGSLYLSVEFVKNGLGLAIALLAIWLVLRALEKGSERISPCPPAGHEPEKGSERISPCPPAGHPLFRTRIALAIGATILAWLTHKMAAGLVVVIALPAICVQFRAHWKLLVGIYLGAIAVLVTVGIAAPRRFLSPEDLALLRHLVSSTPHWDAPALTGLPMNHEALGGLVTGVATIITLIAKPRWLAPPTSAPLRASLWATAILAIVIGFPYLTVDDPQGLAFRLRLVAFVPFALLAGYLARVLIHNLQALDGHALLLAIALALVAYSPRRTSIDGEVVPHPAMVSAVENATIPPATTAIVPERQIAFMVAWYARVPVALRPEQARDRTYVLPLSFIGAGSALDDALMAARREPSLQAPLGAHARHPNGLVVIPDATWQWVVNRLPPDERDRIAAWPTL